MEKGRHTEATVDAPLSSVRLAAAIQQLERFLSFGESDAARGDALVEDVGRAAAIQGFEFTFELAVRLIRRYLVVSEPSAEAPKAMSFNNLIRLAYERALVAEDLRGWLRFREMRNETSHAYDERVADKVYRDIPRFLVEARHLLANLNERIGDLT